MKQIAVSILELLALAVFQSWESSSASEQADTTSVKLRAGRFAINISAQGNRHKPAYDQSHTIHFHFALVKTALTASRYAMP
jgi:hypothetical protein